MKDLIHSIELLGGDARGPRSLWTPQARELFDRTGIMPIGGGLLDHKTVIFDVHQAMAFPMSADSGASATYGTGVRIPAIGQVAINPAITAAELKGDAKIVDRRARLDGVTVSCQVGEFSLDVLAATVGGTVADLGTTPNQIAELEIDGGISPSYWGFVVQFQDVSLGLGMARGIVYKAKLSGGVWTQSQSDQYGQPTLEAGGVARASDNKLVKFQLFQTEADIPTTFPA